MNTDLDGWFVFPYHGESVLIRVNPWLKILGLAGFEPTTS